MHKTITYCFASALACCCLLAAASCGGGSSEGLISTQALPDSPDPEASALPARELPAGITLPDPATLELPELPTRSGSYIDSELQHVGADFEGSLPFDHVFPDAAGLQFNPLNAQDMDDPYTAFAIYRFSAPGYDRPAELRLDYEFDNVDPTFWVGLANWDSGRWDFFSAEDVNKVKVGSMEPYLGPTGDVLAAMVVWGIVSLKLNSIRLGPYPPQLTMESNAYEGTVPLNCTFNVGTSLPGEGQFASFEWDLDGDGVFETDTALVPQVQTVYPDNGVFQPAVRVTNTAGVSAQTHVVVTAWGPWQHSWGRGATDQFSDVLVGEDGSIYACGILQKTSIAADYDALLTHWSSTGELLWAKQWDSADYDILHAIAQDSEGNIIACGQSASGGDYDGLLQKYTPDGSLLWSRSFGGAKDDRLEKLLLDGTDIYAAGTTNSLGPNSDIILLHVDADGNLDWQAARDQDEEDDYLEDLDGSYSLLGGLTRLVLLCKAYNGGFATAWKLEYSTDGSMQDGAILDLLTAEKSDMSLVLNRNIITNEKHYFISGHYSNGSETGLFMSDTDGNGDCVNFTLYGDGPDRVSDMLDDGENGLLVLAHGNADGDGVQDMALFHFTKSLVLFQDWTWSSPGLPVRDYGMVRFHDGALLCGLAPDAALSKSAVSMDGQILDIGFTGKAGSKMTINWTAGTSIGEVTDVTDDGVLDDGAGGSDGLLLYHALP